MNTHDVSAQIQVDAFFSQFQAFSFKTDDVLLRTGEQPRFVYYLKSGVIKQRATSPQGQEVIITLYKTGAFFPLIWAVTEQPLRYDFQAVSHGHGWKAPKEEVITFLKQNAAVTFDLCCRLLSGLEGLGRKIEYMLQANAYVRVSEALLTLAYRFGGGMETGGHTGISGRTEANERARHGKARDAQGTTIQLSLTHQELAHLTGLTRETVSRELKVLYKKGLVLKIGQQFMIPNLSLLEQSIEQSALSE